MPSDEEMSPVMLKSVSAYPGGQVQYPPDVAGAAEFSKAWVFEEQLAEVIAVEMLGKAALPQAMHELCVWVEMSELAHGLHWSAGAFVEVKIEYDDTLPEGQAQPTSVDDGI